MLPGWPYVPLLVVVAACTATLTWYSLRFRGEAGVDWFVALLCFETALALVAAVGLLTTDHELRFALEWTVMGIALWVTIPWFCFAVSYTGYGRWLTTSRLAGLMAVPVAGTLLVHANPGGVAWNDPAIRSVGSVTAVEYTYGPWLAVQVAYIYLVFLAGLAVICWRYVVDDWFETGQGAALFVGVLAPMVAGLGEITGAAPTHPINPIPFALAITGVTYAYALFNHRLLSLVPGTRRLGEVAAVDAIDDGVIVLNGNDRVVTVNPAARALLSSARNSIRGAPVRDVLADEVDLEDCPTTFSSDDGQVYEVSTSSIEGAMGESVGRTVLLKDVTTSERHKQRLQVLHRLLRHNIRNDMNVIRGHAATLREREAGPEADVIESTADELLDLAAKMRRAETLLRENDAETPTDPATIVESVAASIRDATAGGTVRLALETGIELEAQPDVLETVVAELLRNAVEHADTASPTIEVTLERTADGIELRVADDGPGIPEQDRRAITAREETPLEHASGIGLWVVAWGVDQLDGELRFEENDPRGTVVVVRLPSPGRGDGADVEAIGEMASTGVSAAVGAASPAVDGGSSAPEGSR